MSIKKRAVNDEQKAERKQAIVDALANLFREYTYHDINISMIAKKVGLAKATIFLYFATKEELFIELQKQVLQTYFTEVAECFQTPISHQHRNDIDFFAEMTTQIYQNNPLHQKFAPILHTNLEYNISYEVALDFKQFLYKNVCEIGKAIEYFFPFMNEEDGSQLVISMHGLMIGVTSYSQQPEMVHTIVKEEKMEEFDINFATTFKRNIIYLVEGIKARSLN